MRQLEVALDNSQPWKKGQGNVRPGLEGGGRKPMNEKTVGRTA